MDERRLGIFLAVAVLSLAALVLSFVLLKSLNAAVALYVTGFAIALLFVEPFVGLIIYLGLFYVRPHEFVPALQGVPLIPIVGAAAFGSMVVRGILSGRAPRLFHHPQDRLLWWFFAAILASRLSHTEVRDAVISGYTFLTVMVFYFLITNLVTSEGRLRAFADAMVWLTLVIAVQGIVQYFTGTGLAGQTWVEDRRIQSLAGFGNPNALAMALLAALPFLYFDLEGAGGMSRKVFSAAGMAVLLYALYLTNSRGGMVALGGMITVLLIRRTGLLKGLVFGGAAFALIYAFGPSRMSTISPTEQSAFGRILAWQTAFDMLRSNPVFGVGADAWGTKYQSLVAHNSFLHCAAELGLFGLPAWVMLILVSMRNVDFVSRLEAGVPRSVSLFGEKVFFACLSFVLTMLFISKTYNSLLYILIALAAASTGVFVGASGKKHVLFERKDVWYGVLATVLGLVGFGLFVRIMGL
jgi:O-antigen ligase